MSSVGVVSLSGLYSLLAEGSEEGRKMMDEKMNEDIPIKDKLAWFDRLFQTMFALIAMEQENGNVEEIPKLGSDPLDTEDHIKKLKDEGQSADCVLDLMLAMSTSLDLQRLNILITKLQRTLNKA